MSQFKFQYNNKTIVANWKMNPNTYSEAVNLFNLYIKNINNNKINFIVAPPAIYLQAIYLQLLESQQNNIFLSAQNVCWERKGAFTGEISASSLKDLGCEFTIIGHSERRIYNGETDQLIEQKCLAAIEASLTPIICIGETKDQFDNKKTWQILDQQLEIIKNFNNINFFIAYEPVWAIGTGVSADLEYINKVCGYIREKLMRRGEKAKILYGGSVSLTNAKDIFQLSNLDGALIGGASLNAEQFARICELV